MTRGEISDLRAATNVVGEIVGYSATEWWSFRRFFLGGSSAESAVVCSLSIGTSLKAVHRNAVSFCSRYAKSTMAS